MNDTSAVTVLRQPSQRPRRRPVGARATTREARAEAVHRAICVMRDRLSEPLAHEELAQAALLSQYHFNRVFRIVTGVSPGRFLTALRMAEAKRLLLTTPLRVTDVCFSVGFESLGTFTTRFGQFVGIPPQQLRSLIGQYGSRALTTLVAEGGGHGPKDSLAGTVATPAGPGCFAMVGLFATAVPQCLPTACTALWAPGRFRVGPVPPGTYSVLALGFPASRTVLDAMLTAPSGLIVGRQPRAVPGAGRGLAPIELRLGTASSFDPPVVLAGPVLAASAQDKRNAATPAML